MKIDSVVGSYLDPLADKVRVRADLLLSSLVWPIAICKFLLVYWTYLVPEFCIIVYSLFSIQVLIGCVALAMVHNDLLHRK